ncbi:hypothetical protein [Treponema ruminis]|uniref:hypothetical protein n=1 Tax=Treponema ruminis TaxID=744515 RepID=UPI0019802917|nr:hypothetical protein [Treponema ruminis]
MKRLLEKNIIVEFLKRNKDKGKLGIRDEQLEIGGYLPTGRSGLGSPTAPKSQISSRLD